MDGTGGNVKLYILRHGRAGDRETWQGDDADRPLTDDGAARTTAAARGLTALGVQPDVILSSPYARASATAELVAPALGQPVTLESALVPGATLAGVAKLLAAHGDAGAVMLVGHEPDLSTLAGELIAGPKGAAIELKKGACMRIDLPGRAVRHAAVAPEKLAGAGMLVWLLTAAHLGMLGSGEQSHEKGESETPASEPQPEAD
jgi:phosphohistidine phosphatase